MMTPKYAKNVIPEMCSARSIANMEISRGLMVNPARIDVLATGSMEDITTAMAIHRPLSMRMAVSGRNGLRTKKKLLLTGGRAEGTFPIGKSPPVARLQ